MRTAILGLLGSLSLSIIGMTISGYISPAGAVGGSVGCTEGPGYCTATSQCESGQWVPRASDPTACTSGPR